MTERENVSDIVRDIHDLLERMESRLEQLNRQIDLQRDTLDSILVNAMEIADRLK